MKGSPCENTTQAGQSQRPSSSPALSLWPLRNKWSFKYLPATGPPFFFFFPFLSSFLFIFLQAGLLVKHVCLRCFVKQLLFHPLSKTQTTQLAFKETHWKGKTAGYSKHVGTKLSGHISFTMPVLTKSTSWFRKKTETCREELIDLLN